ncbi:hypothetical protein CGI23_25540 [Vibrio parahaemolyticus]|uniref:EAL domain-containing protein n=1 Tax=Vibrio parahaemolyticus TaxID=670 RepID=UPI00111DC132|nr:EAL domain-containing protein [Vibrio parahaemolyticus]TOK17177.1 hypothetical protein CGI23_25540 [Vibrio parahaemolyticus]
MFIFLNHVIELHYQTKHVTSTDEPVGVEVLTRCFDFSGEQVYVGAFLEQVIRSGEINNFTLQLASHAFADLTFYRYDHLSCAINVFQSQLNNRSFLYDFITLANNYAGEVIVELSEKDINRDLTKLHAIQALKSNGITLSLDDFGAYNATIIEMLTYGYDEVKLDRSLLDLDNLKKSSMFIMHLQCFFKQSGIRSVIEGIEDQVHLDVAKTLGVDQVQGFVYSRPVRIYELTAPRLHECSLQRASI